MRISLNYKREKNICPRVTRHAGSPVCVGAVDHNPVTPRCDPEGDVAPAIRHVAASHGNFRFLSLFVPFLLPTMDFFFFYSIVHH
jgi:hypothetical protein